MEYGIGKHILRNGDEVDIVLDAKDKFFTLAGLYQKEVAWWQRNGKFLLTENREHPHDIVSTVINTIDVEMQAWLTKVEAGLEGTTSGDWKWVQSRTRQHLSSNGSCFAQIEMPIKSHYQPDADHIARTNPKHMAELICWLRDKGVMK